MYIKILFILGLKYDRTLLEILSYKSCIMGINPFIINGLSDKYLSYNVDNR